MMMRRMIKAVENEVILAVEEAAEEVSCAAAEVVDGRTTAGEWWLSGWCTHAASFLLLVFSVFLSLLCFLLI